MGISAHTPTATPRFRTKKAQQRFSKDTASQEDQVKTTPTRQDGDMDGSITSELMVSPTKALPGVVTPSIDSNAGGESPRPKKIAKRLFSAVYP